MLKIYRYIPQPDLYDVEDPPVDVNLKTGLTQALERKKTMIQGDITKVEWFVSCTVDGSGVRNYSDLVARSDISYTYDPAGFHLTRDEVITYINEDETEHGQTKTLHKTYSSEGALRAGKQRRSNIVDDLQMKTVGMLLATQTGTTTEIIDLGRAFIAGHKLALDLFVAGSDQSIYNEIVAATDIWLDADIGGGVTIRSVMLSGVNIWGL